MWPRLFCILMGDQDWAGVHGKVWAWAGPAPQPLTFIDRAQSQPLTSIGQPLISISQTPHFYQPEPSLLLARPLTSICQTPHFYWPSQAAPCRTVSGHVGTVPDRAMSVWAVSPCQPDAGTPLQVEVFILSRGPSAVAIKVLRGGGRDYHFNWPMPSPPCGSLSFVSE